MAFSITLSPPFCLYLIDGMVEAFVRTLKRDCVYTSDCEDVGTVSTLLKKWFFDYNNEAPHSLT